MSPSLSKSVQPSSRNMSRYNVRRRLRHLVGNISGTGSVNHNPFKHDQWHLKSFQMRPSLSKSVQPSLRNMSRQIVRRRLRHFFGNISGTGSLRHNPFELDRWNYKSFQMSPSLSKSVQPSLRNMSKIMLRKSAHTYTHTYIHTYTHRHFPISSS